MTRIRIEIPGWEPMYEIVTAVRDCLMRTSPFDPVTLVRSGNVDGIPRFVVGAPLRTVRTDYIGPEYEIPQPELQPSHPFDFMNLFGSGSSGRLASAYSPEDMDQEMRRAKARKARAAVRDPSGKLRKRAGTADAPPPMERL